MTSHTQQLIDRLRPQIDAIREDLAALRPLVAADDAIGAYFIGRIDMALEVTVGCVLLGKGGLAFPLGILLRSMLELTINTFWAASTPERAAIASDAGTAEATRQVKKLLEKRHGKLVNKATGEDATSTILAAIEKNKPGPRKTVEATARECGLGALYDLVYGIQSMPTHGHSVGLSGDQGGDQEIYAMMSAVQAYVKAIHIVAAKFLRLRMATNMAELEKILKVGLVRPEDEGSG